MSATLPHPNPRAQSRAAIRAATTMIKAACGEHSEPCKEATADVPKKSAPVGMILSVVAFLVVLALLAGCNGCGSLPTGEHQQADKDIFDAVAPEYGDYVQADPALSAEQKERRARTVRRWAALVTGTAEVAK